MQKSEGWEAPKCIWMSVYGSDNAVESEPSLIGGQKSLNIYNY
jgi:hypothetical protein